MVSFSFSFLWGSSFFTTQLNQRWNFLWGIPSGKLIWTECTPVLSYRDDIFHLEWWKYISVWKTPFYASIDYILTYRVFDWKQHFMLFRIAFDLEQGFSTGIPQAGSISYGPQRAIAIQKKNEKNKCTLLVDWLFRVNVLKTHDLTGASPPGPHPLWCSAHSVRYTLSGPWDYF